MTSPGFTAPGGKGPSLGFAVILGDSILGGMIGEVPAAAGTVFDTGFGVIFAVTAGAVFVVALTAEDAVDAVTAFAAEGVVDAVDAVAAAAFGAGTPATVLVEASLGAGTKLFAGFGLVGSDVVSPDLRADDLVDVFSSAFGKAIACQAALS